MKNLEINYNEPISIHKTHEGIIWKRSGYCCQCGDCCQNCPALLWIEKTRGVCKDRICKIKQRCNQDITWPPTPDHIKDYPNCTYKFENITDVLPK